VGNGTNTVERKALLSCQPGLQRACQGTGISGERTRLACPASHSFPERWHPQAADTDPGLILYLLAPRSHPPACQDTSLSSSLTCKRRVNLLASTVTPGFWSSSGDLTGTLSRFRAPAQLGWLAVTPTSPSFVTRVISGKRTPSSVFQIGED